MDKRQKKELRRRARAQLEETAEREWAEHMVLSPDQLKALLDYLDEELSREGCDHTLRLTRRWAADQAVDFDRLAESVEHFGGGCDCEVLANVDPVTQVHGWPSYVARFPD